MRSGRGAVDLVRFGSGMRAPASCKNARRRSSLVAAGAAEGALAAQIRATAAAIGAPCTRPIDHRKEEDRATMPTMRTTPVTTAEQLLELHEPGCRHELVRGELRRMNFADSWSGAVAASVLAVLADHLSHRRLGSLVATGTGFSLDHDPDTVRAPAAAFVAASRTPTTLYDGYFNGPPDLAVEVPSWHDSYAYVHEKALFWITCGTRLIWVVEPAARVVTIYRPDGSQHTLRGDDELTGDDVLPGFSARVRELFAD